MKSREVDQQRKRIAEYEKLCGRRSEIHRSLDLLTGQARIGPDTNPKDINFPFTGNTRETRRVSHLVIEFTRTLGGADPMSLRLLDLNIPAGELGRFLRACLETQIESINKEIEAL